jgi:hypothetical protein
LPKAPMRRAQADVLSPALPAIEHSPDTDTRLNHALTPVWAPVRPRYLRTALRMPAGA